MDVTEDNYQIITAILEGLNATNFITSFKEQLVTDDIAIALTLDELKEVIGPLGIRKKFQIEASKYVNTASENPGLEEGAKDTVENNGDHSNEYVGTNMEKYSQDQSTRTQPFIALLGVRKNLDFEEYFVMAENKAIKCSSFIEAVDMCFKVYRVLNAEYPTHELRDTTGRQSAFISYLQCNKTVTDV